jgi:hypothetical protein
MSVELIVALIVVILVAAIIYFNRDTKSLDVNQDGKVDVEDAKAAVEKTVVGVKKEVAKMATHNRKGPGQTSAKRPTVKAKSTKTNGRTRKV